MTQAPIIIKRTSRPDVVADFSFSEKNIPLSGNSEIDELRRNAWDQYLSTPFPNDRDEAWRRTSLAGMKKAEYKIGGDTSSPMPEQLVQSLAGDEQDGRVVIQPGSASALLKPEYAAKGVIFAPLQEAIQAHPELLSKLLDQVVVPTDGKFSALASALAENGLVLYIPAGIKIQHPLHSVFWLAGNKSAFFSRILIWLEADSEAVLVHEYASSETEVEDVFHCGTVEIWAGAGANLKFVDLQSFGKSVWNITHERAIAHEDAVIEWIYGGIGSHLTKSFTDFDLKGRGSTIKVSGFYFADGKQHFDLDTQQNHLAPNTTSDLLYKGAVNDASRSVWQGMIYVAPGSFKTDGYQANRNLVLSSSARSDSIPGLEILADDVRCTHGATVGKIDPEQLYYLQARGLPLQIAKRLVVEGFFEPVMDRIPFEGVRDRLRNAINQKMNTINGKK